MQTPAVDVDGTSVTKRWLALTSAWTEGPKPRRILAELAIVAVDLALATLAGVALDRLGLGADAIVIVYVLAVQMVSLATVSHVVCGVATALSVALFCFFFTEPRYHLVAWGSQYPGTFAVMCIVALVSSLISMRLRRNARESQAASHMMRVLLQTNHALQRCDSVQSVMGEAGRQLARLVSGTVVLYLPNDSGLLEPGALFLPDGTDAPLPDAGALDGTGVIAGPRAPRQPNVPIEVSVAMRAFENGEPAGNGTSLFSSASGFYLPVGEKDGPLGVFAVLGPGVPLSQGERDMARAVAGETSLALGRELAAQKREQAMVLAKNEQLRANLLRSISHDLRTPLTSIGGAADVLLEADDPAPTAPTDAAPTDAASPVAPAPPPALAPGRRVQLERSIRDDARWLAATVENLLAMTRLTGEGVRLTRTLELMDDVVEEALRHVDPKVADHVLSAEPSRGLCLVSVDARLMVQVLVNLVNNAVKYTPAGSRITVRVERHAPAAEPGHAPAAGERDVVTTSVTDDGPGIAPADRDRVFDTFYTVGRGLADGRRSFGLGLALCKSIIEAHGGAIRLEPNRADGHGCVFSFDLPACDLGSDLEGGGVPDEQ